jgi:hypothetical protein
MNVFPPVFAQTEETASTSTLEPPAPVKSDIPHGRFLFDYVLVLVLVAGALCAVCRSSRRV